MYAPLKADPPDIYGDLTLDLEWRKQGGVIVPATSRWTIARASNDTQVDSLSNWSAFGSNLWARTDKGASVWEGRTNSIRNNSMQGAVAGTPGTAPTNWTVGPLAGLSLSIVGTGTSNGIDYIDFRMNGALVGSATVSAWEFETTTGAAATVGQVFSNSVFVGLVGGSTTNIASLTLSINQLQADGTTSNGTQSGSDILPSLTSALQRFTQPAITIAGATTAFARPRIRITGGATGTAVDATIRVGWPQLEQGASVSPPIRTTTTAATRTATSARYSLAGFSVGPQYTLWAEGDPGVPVSFASPQGLFGLDDGTANNRSVLRRHITDGLFEGVMATSGTTSYSNAFGTAWAQGSVARMIGMFAAGDQQAYATGLAGIAGTGPTLPVSPNELAGGSSAAGGSQFFNGNFRKYAIWLNKRIANGNAPALVA